MQNIFFSFDFGMKYDLCPKIGSIFYNNKNRIFFYDFKLKYDLRPKTCIFSLSKI